MSLCLTCQADDAAWRDAPMSVVDGGIVWLDNGSTNTVRAALERRANRVDRYYALVRLQRDLIARICAEKHSRPAQLELFAERAA